MNPSSHAVTHYTLGGVRINEWGETLTPACSQPPVAATSMAPTAPAEMPWQNSRCSADGPECGRQIFAATRHPPLNEAEVTDEMRRIEISKRGDPSVRPIEIKREIKTIMHQYVHHRRNAEGLTRAISEVKRHRRNHSPANVRRCLPQGL